MSSTGHTRGRRRYLAATLLAALACGCVSPTNELPGLAERPPLDRAVLVSGGAFFTEGAEERGTFGRPRVEGASASGEAIPFGSIVDVLERGAVFQRVVADDDPAPRAEVMAFAAELLGASSLAASDAAGAPSGGSGARARRRATEHKRVSNDRMRKLLLPSGLRWPTYREGLRAIRESESS